MDFVKSVQSSELFLKSLPANLDRIRERDKIINEEKRRFMVDDLPKTGLALVTKYCETKDEADRFKSEHPDVNCVVLSVEERERRQKQKYDEDVDFHRRCDARYVVKVVNGGDYKNIEPFIYGLEILVAQNPENLCEFYLFKLCGCIGKICLESDPDHIGYHKRCCDHLDRNSIYYMPKELFIGLVKAKMKGEVVVTCHHSFRGGYTEYTCHPDGTHTTYESSR
jgi:hypothetical protein